MRIAYVLPALLLVVLHSFAQENNSWLAGTWIGRGDVPKSYYTTHFTRTMEITLGAGNNYTCIYTNGINDQNKSMRKELVKGQFYDNQFHTLSSEVIYLKQPPGAKWSNCSSCGEKNEIIIEKDKIKIQYLIRNCSPSCDGTGFYYKLLSSFDLNMQRYLIKRFGTLIQIEEFESANPEKTINKIPISETVRPIIKNKPIPKPATPLTTRKTTPLNTYNISDRELTLELFDDATEDGDTISIYDNGRLIVSKLGLRNTPQQIKVTIDKYNKSHIITLVAENLGKIPPNTAVLRVIAGLIREELQVRLTLKQNASITFNYTNVE